MSEHAPEPAIGIDIGGTKIAAGLIDHDGRIVREVRRETPRHDAVAVEAAVVDVVRELGADAPDAPVGVGAAGWMNLDGSEVLFSPHLAWRNEPLQARLEEALSRPVMLTNDADAAAWAEYRFGAARGESHVVCLTLGTGIGGAIVMGGELRRGRFGVAGEFGHQSIVPGGHRCACGNRGCWEQYASGNALGREGRGLVAAKSPVAHALRAAVDDDPALVTGALVTRLAAEGDPACADLIVEMGEWLGLGLANLAAVLDPGVFVIGGGLGSASPELIETAEASYRKSLSGRGYRPFARVARAQLGAAAGLVGAGDLARTHR
ncbi:ROK family protein [Zhihengliuella halotolerans]|uniref:Glucokinase n=1 Tax=Zhihengliuella halotolerans TaxID=370736 RepID=A0A4Q8AH85_9MICC|nr:ROK family protein [Zhihengliuella halotolerans]RZU63135.1 glucokinase [Zhihengliuella halotolerans]